MLAAVAAAAAAAVITFVLWRRWCRLAPLLPGRLSSAGRFELTVDLGDAAALAERRRDFARVCASPFLLAAVVDDAAAGSVSAPRLLELGAPEDFDAAASALAARGLEIVTDHAFALVSATTPYARDSRAS